MHLCELCVLCGYWSSIFSHVGRPQAGDAYARDDKWRNPFVAPLVRGRRPRSWPGVPSPHGMLSERVAHYRIVEKLGQGGMGEIFSAYDEKLKRTVAIKRISLATLPDDRSRRQFLREALTSGPLAMLGALIAYPALQKLRQRMDPSNFNGAVFLGLNGLVVKSHGGTNAKGFAAAIEVAALMAQSHYREEIASNLARLASAQAPAAQQQDAG